MYTINIRTLLNGFQTFWELVGGALRLDPAAFQAVQQNTDTTLMMIILLFLAGISMTLGQCVVLLANKVKPVRFIASLIFSGIIFIITILIWAAVYKMLDFLLKGSSTSFLQMLRVISLALAPYILGIFILLPYAGSFLEHVFDIWAFLALAVAIAVTLHFSALQALLFALLAWLIIQTLKFTIGRPVIALQRWLMRHVANIPIFSEKGGFSSIMSIKLPRKGGRV